MFILIKSRPELKMGYVRSKTGSLGQILVNHEFTLESTILVQTPRNFARMFIFMQSRPELKIGHVSSKTRSLGQIVVI